MAGFQIQEGVLANAKQSVANSGLQVFPLTQRMVDGQTGGYVLTFLGGLRRRCPEVGFVEITIDLREAVSGPSGH